jgi:hypothetical protein
MLSEHEQKTWNDIQRTIGPEAAERAPTRHSTRVPELPAVVIGGVVSVMLLLLFGELPGAAAVAVVTALVWLLWRFLPPPPASRVQEDEPALRREPMSAQPSRPRVGDPS